MLRDALAKAGAHEAPIPDAMSSLLYPQGIEVVVWLGSQRSHDLGGM